MKLTQGTRRVRHVYPGSQQENYWFAVGWGIIENVYLKSKYAKETNVLVDIYRELRELFIVRNQLPSDEMTN